MATAFIRRMLSRNTEHMYRGDLLSDCNTGCIFRIQDEPDIHILPLVSFVSLLETASPAHRNTVDVYAHTVLDRKRPCTV